MRINSKVNDQGRQNRVVCVLLLIGFIIRGTGAEQRLNVILCRLQLVAR